MLIYFETISKDDAVNLTPQWEKDILYQQICHQIKIGKELTKYQKVTNEFIFIYNSKPIKSNKTNQGDFKKKEAPNRIVKPRSSTIKQQNGHNIKPIITKEKVRSKSLPTSRKAKHRYSKHNIY